MTANERIVLNGLADYLERFNDPPAPGSPDETGWWAKACDELLVFSNNCRNHPLALQAGAAVFSYIETKAKAKGA